MKDKIKEAHKFADRQLIKQWFLSKAHLSNGQVVLILLVLAIAVVL